MLFFLQSTNLNCDKSLGSLLLLNYRSLPSILNIFNSLFYDSLLQPTISSIDSDEVNCLKKLHDRNFFTSSDNTSYSEFGIHFMNINGRNTQQDDSPSWMNMEEAKEVIHLNIFIFIFLSIYFWILFLIFRLVFVYANF